MAGRAKTNPVRITSDPKPILICVHLCLSVVELNRSVANPTAPCPRNPH
jgi:hypothetical protein